MAAGIEVTGPTHERFDEILTPEALDFLASLHREFDARRRELLAARSAATRSSRPAGRWTSSRRPRTSATTTGGSPTRRRAWATAGARSPGRPTRR